MSDPGHWFEAQPLWFKTAVFYEIHIRGFFDGNGDGSGDFRGLTEKLDYLQWLGVDCIWLLPFYNSPLRDGGYDIADYFTIHPDYGARRGRPRLHRGGPPARHPRDRRPGDEPHVVRPPVVPGVALEPGRPQARLVRLVGHRPPLRGRADHLHRHRDVELDLGRAGGRLLLAPLLLPPARPQLRQPRGPGGDARGPALLARPRARRLPPRRRSRTCSSARARTARTCPRRTRTSSGCAPRSTPTTPTACCWPRPTSGRRTSSSTSATATSATWCFHFPVMPRMFMALRREEATPMYEILAQTPDDPGQLPVGPVPAQPRRADARDGHRRGARLHVRGVRQGPAHEDQPRHPPAARAAARQRPRRDRADARDPVLAARARRSSTTATRSRWATTSTSATATACARRCSGRATATAASRARTSRSSTRRR